MPDNVREYYLTLYSYYSQMFIEYLKKNTSLEQYDNNLLNSPLKLKKVEEIVVVSNNYYMEL